MQKEPKQSWRQKFLLYFNTPVNCLNGGTSATKLSLLSSLPENAIKTAFMLFSRAQNPPLQFIQQLHLQEEDQHKIGLKYYACWKKARRYILTPFTEARSTAGNSRVQFHQLLTFAMQALEFHMSIRYMKRLFPLSDKEIPLKPRSRSQISQVSVSSGLVQPGLPNVRSNSN